MTGDGYIAAPVGDGLLLARRLGERLYALNGSARFLWEQRAAGLADSELAPALAEAYGIDPGRAEQDVRTTLRRWREDGLIGEPEATLCCGLAGTVVALRLGARDVEAVLRPLLAPLAPDGHQPRPAAALAVTREAGQLRVTIGEEPPQPARSLDEAVATALAGLARLAFDTADWQLALHGAAVAAPGGGCLVLPGLSGSGKTTLLTALLARGFGHVADDLTLLDEDLVRPLPLPLVLKRGSWRLLGRLIPDLAEARVFRRAEQDVKYWLPPAERIARQPLPVRAILFPRFAGARGVAATRLEPFAALARIMESPARIGRPLGDEALGRLARWLETCPAYELAHDDAAAAAAWAATLAA
ncbi:MAG: PqqD family protein [Dongiaceae bacterium]